MNYRGLEPSRCATEFRLAVFPGMKPVMMTKFGWPHGNCWAACIASILELDIAQVPVTEISGDYRVWLTPWQEWLKERGLALLTFPWDPTYQDFFKGYSILTNEVVGAPLMTDGTKLCHATVALNGICVHDPQPNSEQLQAQQGKLQPFEVTVFLAINPAHYTRTVSPL